MVGPTEAFGNTEREAFRGRRAVLPQFGRTAYGLKHDQASRLAAVMISCAGILSGPPHETADYGFCLQAAGDLEPIAIFLSISAPAPPSIEFIKVDLRLRNLPSWCRPADGCHGDVRLAIANG